MRQKLFLAFMVTFSLNLFLGVRLPATTQTNYSSWQPETSKLLAKLRRQEQVLRQKVVPQPVNSYDKESPKQLLQPNSVFETKSKY